MKTAFQIFFMLFALSALPTCKNRNSPANLAATEDKNQYKERYQWVEKILYSLRGKMTVSDNDDPLSLMTLKDDVLVDQLINAEEFRFFALDFWHGSNGRTQNYF